MANIGATYGGSCVPVPHHTVQFVGVEGIHSLEFK